MAAAASLRGEEMSRMSRLQGCAHEGARGPHAGGGDEQQAAGGRREAAGCKTRGTRCCNAEAGCGRPCHASCSYSHEIAVAGGVRLPLCAHHRIVHRRLHPRGAIVVLLQQQQPRHRAAPWHGGGHGGGQADVWGDWLGEAGVGQSVWRAAAGGRQAFGRGRAGSLTSCSAPKVARSPRLKLLFFRLQHAGGTGDGRSGGAGRWAQLA